MWHTSVMKRVRWIVLALLLLWVVACVRVRYQKLGWGGYWSVELVAPWQR